MEAVKVYVSVDVYIRREIPVVAKEDRGVFGSFKRNKENKIPVRLSPEKAAELMLKGEAEL